METTNHPEPAKNESVPRRVVGAFIASIQFVRHQLDVADLNPHEGRLRGSVMPSEYIQVPDYPPIHDDTI